MEKQTNPRDLDEKVHLEMLEKDFGRKVDLILGTVSGGIFGLITTTRPTNTEILTLTGIAGLGIYPLVSRIQGENFKEAYKNSIFYTAGFAFGYSGVCVVKNMCGVYD
jgi:hypothetical protein